MKAFGKNVWKLNSEGRYVGTKLEAGGQQPGPETCLISTVRIVHIDNITLE